MACVPDAKTLARDANLVSLEREREREREIMIDFPAQVESVKVGMMRIKACDRPGGGIHCRKILYYSSLFRKEKGGGPNVNMM